MKVVVINTPITNGNRLHRELALDLTLGGNFEGVTTFKLKTEFYFSDAFDSAAETYLRSVFMAEFIDEDNSLDFEPKIYGMVSGAVKDMDIHDIDYKLHVRPNLVPKRTMVKGTVTCVDWFSDKELTNKVVAVCMSYERDQFGFAVSRTTTRKWVLNNNELSDDVKITTKHYNIDLVDQIREGRKRRQNILENIQLPTLAFMIETLAPLPNTQILLLGREFMDRFDIEFNKFIANSSTVTDLQDPNVGRKSLAVAFEAAPDTWLDNAPVALGGATIRVWLVNEVSI